MSLIKSLEELDREHTAKRARLERDHKLAATLPTLGTMVEWTGENGWDNKGASLPPVAKSVQLFPYLIHSRTAYKEAEHVAFRAPDGNTADPHSEHVSSKHRPEFTRKYLRALLDACAPHMLETVAVRCNAQARSKYAGFFAADFDYKAKTGGSYEHADETARGLFVLEISRHTGEHGYSTAELEFYVSQPERCKVSFDLSRDGWPTHRLAPVPRYTSDAHNAGVASWSFHQPGEVGAVELFKRASADSYSGGNAPRGYTVQYLIPDRETLDALLGLSS